MIVNNKFPNELVPNKEKLTKEFAKQYATAIWSEWQSKYLSRKDKNERLRKYALGKHPIQHCINNIKKKYIKEEFLSIDKNDRVKLLPTHLREFYNNVDFKDFAPIVKSISPLSLKIKEERKQQQVENLYAKDFILKATELNGGVPLTPLDEIPKNKEEIELKEQTAKPLQIEIAEEVAIQGVALHNDFDEIQKDILKDAVEVGYGVAKVINNSIEGIKIDRVNPDGFLHSYTDDRFFKDCRYFAEVTTLPIHEVLNIINNSDIEVSAEQLKEIKEKSSNGSVNVLFYYFKTYFKEVYKSKKNRNTNALSLIDRTEDEGTERAYNPKYKSDKSKKIECNYPVWLKGCMVLSGSMPIIEHGKMKNMPSLNGKVQPPYIAFAPRIKNGSYNSMVEEVSTIVDSIQELKFRINHQRSKLRGVVTEIDPDSIANITLGKKKLTPEEVLSFYFSLDLAFRKTVDEEGDYIGNKSSLREIPTAIPYALRELATQYISEIQRLSNCFGFNGNNKQSLDNNTTSDYESYRLPNTTTLRDYTNDTIKWSGKVFQLVSSMINDVISMSTKDNLYKMINVDDAKILKRFIEERDKHFFNVYIDYSYTKQERAELLTMLRQYAGSGMLDPLDVEEISNVKNKKQALSLLRLKTEARKSQLQDNEMAKINANQNSNAMSARISQEEKRKTLMLEAQIKEKEETIAFERKVFLTQKEGEIQIAKERVKSENKLSIEEFRKRFEADLTAFKESNKKELAHEKLQIGLENQEKLVKLRKGQIDNVRDTDYQEIDLIDEL